MFITPTFKSNGLKEANARIVWIASGS